VKLCRSRLLPKLRLLPLWLLILGSFLTSGILPRLRARLTPPVRSEMLRGILFFFFLPFFFSFFFTLPLSLMLLPLPIPFRILFNRSISSTQQSGQLVISTFQSPNNFFFLNLTLGWRTQYPLRSNMFVKISSFSPPFPPLPPPRVTLRPLPWPGLPLPTELASPFTLGTRFGVAGLEPPCDDASSMYSWGGVEGGILPLEGCFNKLPVEENFSRLPPLEPLEEDLPLLQDDKGPVSGVDEVEDE